MAYYSAYYGSWNDPHGVQRIEFGEDRGIHYLFKIDNYREAITKAQAVANQTGKIVHFCKETPIAGGGMRSEWREVYPIREKICHIRMYKQYRENWYDVVYTSGRIVTYTEPYLSTTAKKFIDSSEIRREHGGEMFYY